MILTTLKEEEVKMKADMIQSLPLCPGGVEGEQAGRPGSVIQAFVDLQTQTLNVIRCWLDKDKV